MPQLDSAARSAVVEAAREVVADSAKAVAAAAGQIDESFVAVTCEILECTGKVIISGSGTSGAVARRMAHLLSVTGSPSIFLHPMDGLHGSLGAVSVGDVVLAISKGGESAEVNDFAVRARARGARIIGLTADATSSLGRLADVTVTLVTPEGADPGEVIAMGSTLAMSAWGDALAVTTMRMRGYSWTDVLFTHPAGAVGLRTDVVPTDLAPLGGGTSDEVG